MTNPHHPHQPLPGEQPRRPARARACALTLAGLLGAASAMTGPQAAGTAGAADDDGPPTVSGRDLRFTHPNELLRHGDARAAGLTPRHVARIVPDTARYLRPSPTHPEYAGASVLAAHRGVIVADHAVGHAVLYADAKPALLPPGQRVAARPDTIWDLASLTKLFTTLVALQLVERHQLTLDTPVAQRIPEFAQHGKAAITVRQLLTHTSGLPADLPLWRDWHTYADRVAAVYAVEPVAGPGSAYRYSDLNMITLGKLVERVSGTPLNTLVARGVTGPLGMRDTGFNPPAAKLSRIAATEYQTTPDRGMLRGVAHDENAWALSGVAGHAGMFSTTHDLATLCQAILNGGRYGHARVLSPDSVRILLTNLNTAFAGDAHGLGLELGQRWYMDALASPVTAGHTGFTGTSLVIDPLSDSFVILLANRTHPTRAWGSANPARRAVARDLAMALPVRAPGGGKAWFAGPGGPSEATLAAPLRDPTPEQGGELSFALWYDTASGAGVGTVEGSDDDGATWRRLPLRLEAPGRRWRVDGVFSGFQGRQWLRAHARLPPGLTTLRWRYSTDSRAQGRGVYVTAVLATAAEGGGTRILFDQRDPDDAASFDAAGWTRSAD